MSKEDKNITPELDLEDKDLQKSLDDSLQSMNDLIKSKKALSKEDVSEMMKNPKNKDLFKEYMKDEEGEEEDEELEEEEKMKKSLESIHENHDEVIDAVPVLKSFSEVLETLSQKTLQIEKGMNDLQKSMNDSLDLQKSFGEVVTAQSDLMKSVNDEIESLGNTPNPVKGKFDQKDLFKSDLDDGNDSESKLVGAPRQKVKEILLKSFEEGDNKVSGKTIAKWEQSGYNMSVFSKEELAHVESKL